jgi:hypothetical protein
MTMATKKAARKQITVKRGVLQPAVKGILANAGEGGLTLQEVYDAIPKDMDVTKGAVAYWLSTLKKRGDVRFAHNRWHSAAMPNQPTLDEVLERSTPKGVIVHETVQLPAGERMKVALDEYAKGVAREVVDVDIEVGQGVLSISTQGMRFNLRAQK